MKESQALKKLIALCLALLSTSAALAALQTPINFNFSFNGSNAVQISWNAYPGKSYVLQTATNLSGSWSNSATLVATSNSLSFNFPTTAKAQFFKVVKLDTEGPQIYQTSPLDGAIAVSPQSAVQVWLSDATGINTNSITFAVGTNAPISLPNPQLVYSNGLLTFTPATNVFLGTNGQVVVARISVADTLGNVTTNFTWSFQIALPSVPSTNLLFIPGSSGFVLVATNGTNYTFSYPGTFPGLTNGEILVNTNLSTGYTLAVVAFTNYPASNTVLVLTRAATLAEMLQLGSVSSATFTQLGSSGNAAVNFSLKGAATLAGPKPNFALQNTANLQGTLYQDANLLIELLPGSQLTLNSDLAFSANFSSLKLNQFSATLASSAGITLNAHVHATGALARSGSIPLITPVKQFYGGFIGPVPVWVELVLEINAGYTLNLEASGDYTAGITGTEQILTGRSWSQTSGWTALQQNPTGGFSFLTPTWQAETTDSLNVYLQPKLTLYVYSAAGVSGDLQPYLELDGNAQLNPQQWDLALYGGLTSTVGLDLSVWDKSWGELPSQTFTLIPETLLWETNSMPPQIVSQPQDDSVTAGQTATFSVTANGDSPLTYLWQRNGLSLTDDGRITGSQSSTLQITGCSSDDVGSYGVKVRNSYGITNSRNALLTVNPTNILAGMALIPAGNFTMGDNLDGESDAPVHSVYVSAFYMDKYDVTEGLWQQVYTWAVAHGYSFDNSGSVNDGYSKGPNYPVVVVDWYDCAKWCNARSEMEGRTPAYYTSAAQTTVYRTGDLDLSSACVNWGAGYRLATEAEWEKAARGGLSGQRFPWGNTINESQANYYAYPLSLNSGGYSYDVNSYTGYNVNFATGNFNTSSVNSFAPNGYGLYDMAGNVWQWCWDWYGTYAGVSDPRGPASGSNRVVRGGGWRDNAFSCRAAGRGYNFDYPADSYGRAGFRSVLPPGQ